MSDLDLAFTAYADESMALANETFAASAEVWLRECVWPGCPGVEQQLQLADEIGCDLIGETHPDPAVYDQRAAYRCAAVGPGWDAGGRDPNGVPRWGNDSQPTP
jgi:hypothetical protein